jgi:CheY-like chemotaxis protein
MGAKILVIDDTPANRLAFEALLSRQGDKVVVAESGEEGIEKALREEFAVILVDVKMAGMDGYETADLLRKCLDAKKTSIVLMTAHDTPSWTIARMQQKGIADFFTSPIDPDYIEKRVAELVGRSGA